MKPSPQQQAVYDALAQHSSNIMVSSVAGSGKTTLIVGAASRVRGSTALLAFNKRMAVELTERGGPGVHASTFHKLGLEAWKAGFGWPEIDKNKVFGIASAFCEANSGFQAWPLTRFVSLLKQEGVLLDPSTAYEDAYSIFDHFDLMDDLPDGASEQEFIHAALNILKQSNAAAVRRRGPIDFDDMLYLPLLHRLRWPTFDTVFVDEAQDTNLVRREVIKRLNARTIAVGDPQQAIYGFAGASVGAFDLLQDQLSATRMPLSVSYRCPQAVVRHAQSLVPHMEAHETAPEGSVTEASLATLLAEAAPGDAILCRVNAPTVSLAFTLLRAGKKVRIEGRDIGAGIISLAQRWKVPTVSAFLEKAGVYLEAQAKKAEQSNKKGKARRLRERLEILQIIAEGVASDSMHEYQQVVKNLFTDTPDSRAITLSSVHKAKGLEWPRVWLLGRNLYMPLKYAKAEWEIEQEQNIIYVAITRAKQHLIEVPLEN